MCLKLLWNKAVFRGMTTCLLHSVVSAPNSEPRRARSADFQHVLLSWKRQTPRISKVRLGDRGCFASAVSRTWRIGLSSDAVGCLTERGRDFRACHLVADPDRGTRRYEPFGARWYEPFNVSSTSVMTESTISAVSAAKPTPKL